MTNDIFNCARMPLINSMQIEVSLRQLIPNFSLICPANFASEIASCSCSPLSTISFFKNFFKLLPNLLSTSLVAALSASEVFLNFENFFKVTLKQTR